MSRLLIALVVVAAVAATGVFGNVLPDSFTEKTYPLLCTPSAADAPICYSNVYGNWRFVCDGSNVNLYKCTSVTCASGCSTYTTFANKTAVRSNFDGSTTFNLTGPVYTVGGTFVNVKYYYSSDNCSKSGSTPYAINNFPQSSTRCIRRYWSSSTDRWSCTAGGNVVRDYYAFSSSCSGSATTTTRTSGRCANEDRDYWDCVTQSTARAVIFAYNSAGAVVSVVAAAVAIGLTLIA